MQNKLKNLVITKVSLVPEGACSAAHIKLFKQKDDSSLRALEEAGTPQNKKEQEGGIANMTLEQVMEALEKEHLSVIEDAISKAKQELPEGALSQEDAAVLKAQVAALEEEKAQAAEVKSTEATTPSEEELLKTADPALVSLIQKVKAQAVAAEELAKTLNKEKKESILLEKSAQFKNLPKETKEIAEVLGAIEDEQVLEKVCSLLKAANDAIESSLTEVGTSSVTKSAATGSQADEVAWEDIEKEADSIVSVEKISKEAAIAKVIKEKPELYRAYLDAQKQ